MQTGNLALYFALFSTLLSAWFYFRAAQPVQQTKKTPIQPNYNRYGRLFFYLMSAFIVGASIYLWVLIFNHQFQVDYISRYTSRSLGTGFLISAFWAGQEGSFLFWALMIALMGLFYIPRARKFENWSMVFVNLVQAGFLLILFKANPFALGAQTPPDGAGLNPLLQNLWMVIHPPILFLGYAAVTFPFAIVLTVLVQNEYKDWVKEVFPWALFASVTLGAGIIIGGFWAYEVLGWGGYWGWDPVENSSLVAWLAVLALFHSLIVTRRNGALQKTSMALGIASFVLVLYATYLTRSGVLADFSVHSFQESGINGLMLGFQLAALVPGLVLIFLRREQIGFRRMEVASVTKESALLFTVTLLSVSAFLTLIGTSSPILSRLIGPSSQVSTDFYNRVNLPLAILMGLLLGLAPFLAWRQQSFRDIMIRIIFPALAAAAAAVVLYLYGMASISMLLFALLAVFGLLSNAVIGWQKFRLGWKQSAASISHIGLGLMFIGIAVSGTFSQEKRVLLEQGKPLEVLGAQLVYQSDFNSPDGKHGLIIDVKDGDDTFVARPRLYNNNYTRSEMREPYVRTGVFSDFYISPLQKQAAAAHSGTGHLDLKKGQRVAYAGYEIEFISFDMTSHQDQQGMQIGANLILRKDGQSYEAKPLMLMAGGQRKVQPAHLDLPGTGHVQIVLQAINADSKSIHLDMGGFTAEQAAPEAAKIVVEVSRKPFMNVLWLGTILLTIGTIIAVIRRSEDTQIQS